MRGHALKDDVYDHAEFPSTSGSISAAHQEANLIRQHITSATHIAAAVALLLPLLLQAFGTHFVRTVDTCLLYVLLALGMNVVVGYAGLLDRGYAAFYAVGAYVFALLASSHLSLQESVMIVARVMFGGIGHVPGVILGAVLLTAFPEKLRYVVGPLQAMTDGRLDAGILRQLLIALAMIVTMVLRPRGLWPAPEHGKSLRADADSANASTIRAARPDA